MARVPLLLQLLLVLGSIALVASDDLDSVGVSSSYCNTFRTPTTGSAYWDPPTRPVLLIPGVAGSQLFTFENAKNNSEYKVWLSWMTADCGDTKTKPWEFKPANRWVGCTLPEYLYAQFNNKTNRTESMKAGHSVFVPPDDSGICAIDDLAKNIPFQTNTWMYHAMIDNMVKMGYKIGSTLFGYPFDWRQSVNETGVLNGLRDTIIRVYQANNNTPLDIVSHSMGGLLMQSYLAAYPDEAAQYVHAWSTVCTPYQGAPIATNGMIEGYNLGNWAYGFGLSNKTGHHLVMNYPSYYDLLPSTNWTGNVKPTIEIVLPNKKTQTFTPADYPIILGHINELNTFMYSFPPQNVTVSNKFNMELYNRTRENRRLWNSVKLSESPISFRNIFMNSTDTAMHLKFRATSFAYPELSGLPATVTWTLGDGTVPTASAQGHMMGDEMFREETDFVYPVHKDPSGYVYNHQNVLGSPYLFNYVRELAGTRCSLLGKWTSSLSELGQFELLGNVSQRYLSPNERLGVGGIDRVTGSLVVKTPKGPQTVQFDIGLSLDCLTFVGSIGKLDKLSSNNNNNNDNNDNNNKLPVRRWFTSFDTEPSTQEVTLREDLPLRVPVGASIFGPERETPQSGAPDLFEHAQHLKPGRDVPLFLKSIELSNVDFEAGDMVSWRGSRVMGVQCITPEIVPCEGTSSDVKKKKCTYGYWTPCSPTACARNEVTDFDQGRCRKRSPLPVNGSSANANAAKDPSETERVLLRTGDMTQRYTERLTRAIRAHARAQKLQARRARVADPFAPDALDESFAVLSEA